jgi:HK97 family phage portal protein
MRALADSYDLLRLVIETRKDQVERMRWNIRPKVQAGTPTPAAAGDPRVAALEAFFRKPDGTHRWGTWLRMLLEDLFVIDAPALYKARSVGGALLALEPVDGATIKVLIDDQGRTPAAPDPAYQQVLHGVPKADFDRDMLIYLPRNPRTAKIYGFSPVEQIITTVNIALRRQLAQLQYFTEGNMPEALIGVPQSWTMEQIGQFQDYWDTILAGNTAERRHAKFVPSDFRYQPMRDPPLKDDFDEWLARIVAFAFSLPPTPFVRQMNRATAGEDQDRSLEEGLSPLKAWVKRLIDGVNEAEFGETDLEFAWHEQVEVDPNVQSDIDDKALRNGSATINEIRARRGQPPLAGGDTPRIYDATGAQPLQSASASPPAAQSPL